MIKPISKKKYYETISEQISQAILSGEWPEGSRVPTEDELATIFNVGRGSIREAITNLQMSGVLFSSPGIGTYVADNAVACINNSMLADMLREPEKINDILNARLILEPEIASQVALKANSKDVNRMQKAIDTARSSEGNDGWKKTGHLFHIALCDALDNEILTSFFKTLEEPTRKMRKDEITEELKAQTLDQYQAILDAIADNDAEKAADLMRELLK